MTHRVSGSDGMVWENRDGAVQALNASRRSSWTSCDHDGAQPR
jgi:hypothetical protein